jgi:hypothetical protein
MRSFLRTAIALFVLSVPVLAQTPSAAPPEASLCKGTAYVVRVSEIKPGKMDTFLAALKAHQAWYRDNGATDTIYAMKIINRNPDGKYAFSDTEVMTVHEVPAGQTGQLPVNNASWKAYVAMYQDSSTIKTQWRTCKIH